MLTIAAVGLVVAAVWILLAGIGWIFAFRARAMTFYEAFRYDAMSIPFWILAKTLIPAVVFSIVDIAIFGVAMLAKKL